MEFAITFKGDIDPKRTVGLCKQAEVAGFKYAWPARVGVPTIMLFVQSLRGLSHAKEEDTKEEHIAQSVQALDRLASKTMNWLVAQGS